MIPLLGCGPTPSSSDPAVQGELTETVENTEPAAEAVPVIAADEAVFDFGTISPTESVTHVFKIVNRGSADLHIERVERT